MNPNVLLAIPLLPLCAAILAGLAGKWIGRTGSHVVTIAAVGASFVLSAQIAWQLITGEVSVYNDTVYTWLVSDGIRMEVGFLVDQLSVLMMCVTRSGRARMSSKSRIASMTSLYSLTILSCSNPVRRCNCISRMRCACASDRR